jgi:hypothetical protein
MNKITILTKPGQAWFVAILLLTLPAISLAKGTTSAIRGTVTTPNGNAASGASVKAVDTRTGRGTVYCHHHLEPIWHPNGDRH